MFARTSVQQEHLRLLLILLESARRALKTHTKTPQDPKSAAHAQTIRFRRLRVHFGMLVFAMRVLQEQTVRHVSHAQVAPTRPRQGWRCVRSVPGTRIRVHKVHPSMRVSVTLGFQQTARELTVSPVFLVNTKLHLDPAHVNHVH